MRTMFYVENKRLDECKAFIREFLKTARFEQNPVKIGDKWNLKLCMDAEDGNKLNELFNKWHDEDNMSKKPKKSFWKRIFGL